MANVFVKVICVLAFVAVISLYYVNVYPGTPRTLDQHVGAPVEERNQDIGYAEPYSVIQQNDEVVVDLNIGSSENSPDVLGQQMQSAEMMNEQDELSKNGQNIKVLSETSANEQQVTDEQNEPTKNYGQVLSESSANEQQITDEQDEVAKNGQNIKVMSETSANEQQMTDEQDEETKNDENIKVLSDSSSNEQQMTDARDEMTKNEENKKVVSESSIIGDASKTFEKVHSEFVKPADDKSTSKYGGIIFDIAHELSKLEDLRYKANDDVSFKTLFESENENDKVNSQDISLSDNDEYTMDTFYSDNDNTELLGTDSKLIDENDSNVQTTFESSMEEEEQKYDISTDSVSILKLFDGSSLNTKKSNIGTSKNNIEKRSVNMQFLSNSQVPIDENKGTNKGLNKADSMTTKVRFHDNQDEEETEIEENLKIKLNGHNHKSAESNGMLLNQGGSKELSTDQKKDFEDHDSVRIPLESKHIGHRVDHNTDHYIGHNIEYEHEFNYKEEMDTDGPYSILVLP